MLSEHSTSLAVCFDHYMCGFSQGTIAIGSDKNLQPVTQRHRNLWI